MLPTLLAASVAVPYTVTNGPDWAKDLTEKARSSGAGATPSGGDPLDPQALAASPQGPGALLYPNETPLEGLAVYSVADVLRMDVTKDWVYQRWSRKSTVTADLDLYGVRVPLVTGTELTDLAGSLTYYFGHDGRVHRLAFRGRTGDTTELVYLVVQRFGLMRQPSSPGVQLFQIRRGDEVISQLRTRPATVLWSSAPHESFDVELELQRPETAKPIRPDLPQTTSPAQTGQTGEPASAGGQPAGQSGAPPNGKAKDGDDSPKVTDPDGWKLFFPRSRVPKPQVESLDERRRMW